MKAHMDHHDEEMDRHEGTSQVKRAVSPPSSEQPPAEQELTRRNFLKLGLGALSAVAAIELGGVGILFLKARSQEGKFGGKITAGTLEDFPHGSVTEFEDGNFYLIRSQDGGFLSVYRRCPHLGCTVDWVEAKQRFYCPCHASSFDMYGDFVSQPVPRALDSFAITIKDGQVVVDTSQITRREKFSPEQLTFG
jgi:cytochrome b6-f complex iron-sulfur subunit